MFRWTTAGESHGQALIALVEDVISGLPLSTDEVATQLARRRLGYGRSARESLLAAVVFPEPGSPTKTQTGEHATSPMSGVPSHTLDTHGNSAAFLQAYLPRIFPALPGQELKPP